MRYHAHLFQSCLEALDGIFFEGRHADKSIEFYFKKNRKWGGRDRRFFAETVYDCVRWWRLYWHILGRSEHPGQIKILAVSLWNRSMELPEWEDFKHINLNVWEKRKQEIESPAVKHGFPDWLYEKMFSELGNGFFELVPHLNQTNYLVLRTNTQKIKPQILIQKLAEDKVIADTLTGTEAGLIIKERSNVFKTKAFKEGLFEVQDGSSQQVARFLDIQPGQRVVDACAGAGGKTLHIADLLNNKGKVIALDVHDWKLDQLKLRARRNNYSNIERKIIDGTKTIKRLKGTADRLLLDVPCSGLGVLKRNPDTKWKVSQKSLDNLCEIQSEILQQYSQILKVGGQMVYATCSILPSENEQQVQKFLEKNLNFKLLKQRNIYPVRPGFDGFFMSLLKKTS